MVSTSVIHKENFIAEVDGKEVSLFKLVNSSGMSCFISNYGCRIVSLNVPDRDSNLSDVVLGYDHLQEYIDKEENYFGALVGRYANRISNARFELDGKVYHLQKNLGQHHIHGGGKGFSKVVWDVDEAGDNNLIMSYLSSDGEEGYPGNLKVRVHFHLSEQNELVIRYSARTDRPTPINLTDHTYFNLAGAGNGKVDGHLIRINAETFTVTDKEGIPSGEVRSVEGSDFDFREGKELGSIQRSDFDLNYIIEGEGLREAAEIYEPSSGRRLTLKSTNPGLQFYNACNLSSGISGKNELQYGPGSAFCLEPQFFPDSPNRPEFPSSILRPNNIYRSENRYSFSVD